MIERITYRLTVPGFSRGRSGALYGSLPRHVEVDEERSYLGAARAIARACELSPDHSTWVSAADQFGVRIAPEPQSDWPVSLSTESGGQGK